MADKMMQQLQEATSVSAADLFLTTVNPNGTPVDKKITTKNLFGSISVNVGITSSTTTITANTTINGVVILNSGNNSNFDFRVRGGVDNALLFADSGNNSIGIGTAEPQTKLDIADSKLRLRTDLTPSNSNAVTNGVKKGTFFWDANYLYIVTSDTTIKRVALTSF